MNNTIPLELELPFKSIYPIKTNVVVEWPYLIGFNGEDYYRTGKVGTNIGTKLPTAEYYRYSHNEPESAANERIWLQCDGTITED